MAGSLDFLINIQQKLTGGNVAGELATLESKIKGETKALQALEAWMKRIQSGSSVDVAQYQKVQGLIDAKKSSLAGLSEQLAKTGEVTDAAGASTAGLGEQLSALASGPAGIAAAALAAVVTILVVAAYKLTAFALAAANAARSFKLILEGASGSTKAAAEMSAAVDRVSSSSAVAGPELEKMAQTLAVAGLKGKLFEDSLRTMAAVASVAGPQAAGKLEEIAKKVTALGHFEIGGDSLAGLGISMEDLARSMGTSVDKLKADMKAGSVSVEQGVSAMNKALNARLGGVAARQALDLNVQASKLQENLAKLFKNVDIEPFLKALRELLSIFDASSASGKAMQAVATEVFSALFAGAARVLPYIKALLQGMFIAGLLLYIAIKPIGRAIVEAFGGASSIDGLSAALFVGKLAFIAVLLVLGLIGIALASVAAAVAFVAAPFLIVGAVIVAAIYGVVAAVGWLKNAFSLAVAFISGLDLGAIASGMLDGLVNGIRNGAGIVLDAIKSLGSSMIGGLKGVLGIASPSKVFAGLGQFSAKGFAVGLDEGSAEVEGAVSSMVETPSKGGAAGGVRAGGSGGGPLLVIEHLEIHGEGAADIWAQLEERLNALLEGVSLSGPEPTGATT